MKYPIILQEEYYSCGPTCIYMLCEYYHISFDKQNILLQTKTSTKGTNIWHMQKTLRSLDFTSNAVFIQNFYLYDYEIPTIAVIRSSKKLFHYVIIYNRLNDTLIIGDPAYGLYPINIKNFLNNFTGILIIPTY